MSTPAPLRRARDTGAQKWLRDPASLKASVVRCLPSADLLEHVLGRGLRASRLDRRHAADVHVVDHGDGRVGLGQRRHDRREGAWAEARAAMVRRQGQSEKPRLPERFDSFA